MADGFPFLRCCGVHHCTADSATVLGDVLVLVIIRWCRYCCCCCCCCSCTCFERTKYLFFTRSHVATLSILLFFLCTSSIHILQLLCASVGFWKTNEAVGAVVEWVG
ncbi:unnamed protein product [Sphacelaria rigidula]